MEVKLIKIVEYAHEVSHEWRRRRVFRGLSLIDAHLNPDPLLLAAAEHHGEPASSPCPHCGSEDLRVVKWVYSDLLGRRSGTARSDEEIARLVDEVGPITVHFVEVCRPCGWNFLLKEVTACLPR